MADRVVIIGGNEPLRDHFPAGCSPNIADIGSPATGNHTQYALGVDIAQACRWFYLVRWWALSIAAGYSIYDNTGTLVSSHTGSLYVEVSLPVLEGSSPVYTVPSREAELVLARAEWGMRIGGGSIQDDGGASTRAFAWSFPSDITNVTGQASGGALLFVYNMTLNPIWDGAVFRFRSYIFGVAGDLDISSLFSDDASGSAAGTMSVDGASYPINKAGAGAAGHGTMYVLDSITASFTPVEFWPFKTKTGLVVYNTSTGVIINDPAS